MDYIIFSNFGSIIEKSLNQYVQQGSTGVNKFFVIFVGPLGSDGTSQAVFTLPNQETNTLLGEYKENYPYEADDPENPPADYDGRYANGWLYTLTTDQTTYPGLLFVAVRILRPNGGPAANEIYVNYPFTMVINETGVMPDTPSGLDLEQIDSYLLNLQELVSQAIQGQGIYVFKGSRTVSQLNLMSHFPDARRIGDVYNVTDSGTLTAGNVNVIPGDNVAWNGIEWDKLASITVTNIVNGIGVNSVFQSYDTSYGDTIDMSVKNPNAWALYQESGASTYLIDKGATGDYSVSLGGISAAVGKRALAEGTNTIAIGKYSHAEGDNSVALGNESHAEGNQTVTSGSAAHSEGYGTQAIGNNSHAEGAQTITEGENSHAEGYGTIVKAGYVIIDTGETPSPGPEPSPAPTPTPTELDSYNGLGAHAEGHNNFVMGSGAHAEGDYNKAYGRLSHAEGRETQTGQLIVRKTENGKDYYTPDQEKQFQHAEGFQTKAIGHASHAGGLGTVTNYAYQTAVGKYNDNKLNTLLEVGNGQNPSHPSNALEVYDDGRIAAGANPTNSMDLATKGYVDGGSYLKTINGQAITGSGNIQIAPTSSGLFKHTISIRLSGSQFFSLAYHVIIIDNNSSAYTATTELARFVGERAVKAQIYADNMNLSGEKEGIPYTVLRYYYSGSGNTIQLKIMDENLTASTLNIVEISDSVSAY